MTAKLRIDLLQGVLEVEGSETFVKAIYNDFKSQFIRGEKAGEAQVEPPPRRRRARSRKAAPKIETPRETAPILVKEAAPAPAPVEAPRPAPPAVPAYVRIKNLELSATPEHPSLVEFMDSKLPITNEERNLVFLYYLQSILHLEAITPDHVYTCYRQANIRAPQNLEYSLRMTATQKGWIKFNGDEQMVVTPEGKLYVEKQLPKKVKG